MKYLKTKIYVRSMINMERKVLKISSKEVAMKAGTFIAMTLVSSDVCL